MRWIEGEKEAGDCLLVGSADGKVKGHCNPSRATGDNGRAKSVGSDGWEVKGYCITALEKLKP